MAFVYRSKRPMEPAPKECPLINNIKQKLLLPLKSPLKGMTCQKNIQCNQKLLTKLKPVLCIENENNQIKQRQNNSLELLQRAKQIKNRKRNPFAPILKDQQKNINFINGNECQLQIDLSKKKIKKSPNRLKELIQSQKKITPNINLLQVLQNCSKDLKNEKQNDSCLNSNNKKQIKKWVKHKKPIKTFKMLNKSIQKCQINDKQIRYGTCPRIKSKQKLYCLKPNRPLRTKSNESESSYSQQQDAFPGPGAYECPLLQKKKDFRSKKESFRNIFISQLTRFPQKQSDQINCYQQQQIKINRKLSPHSSFLSKTPKHCQQKLNDNPAPGHYQNRQTLQYKMLQTFLASAIKDVTPKKEFEQHQSVSPGPGAYHLSDPILKSGCKFACSSESKMRRQKSPQKANRIKQLISQISNDDISIIHVKDYVGQVQSNQFGVSPPFCSSAPRFKPPQINEVSIKRQKQKQTIKVYKQAFNSSQKRQIKMQSGDGVGVGLYTTNHKSWKKKSFNVIFN